MTERNRLEDRYRRVLRLLPAPYRLAWEEEMVATFLATMHTDDPEQASYLADYGRPSWSEVASVVALAVRLRVGTAGTPRYVAWGAALRVVALVALFVHAAAGAPAIGIRLWLTGRLPMLPAAPEDWSGAVPTGVWPVVLDLTGLVWLAAFLALVLDRRRAAWTFAAIGLAVQVVNAAASTVDFGNLAFQPLVVSRWTYVLVNAALVLALVAFHSDAPSPAPRPWLLALPIGVAVVIALQVLTPAAAWPWLDWSAMCAAAFAGAAVVHLAVPARRRALDWAHALALLGGVVVVQRLLTLIDYALGRTTADPTTALLLGVAEAGVVLALVVPLWQRTRHALPDRAAMAIGGARW